MNLISTKVTVGTEKPFRLLHISDTHITLCDERDDERKQKLAASRTKSFPYADRYLTEAEIYAKENNMPIAHTGDLIDFVSYQNLDRAKKFTAENDVFFAAGNHEFSLYVGEAFEDEAYRNQSLDKVQAAFTNDIRFFSRKINGVNLIAIDDGYYRFDLPQYEALQTEIAYGLPIILFMHNPLYEQSLYDMMGKRGSPCAYLTSTPVELMKNYSEYRFRQQNADEITWHTTRLIENCPLIKAIFTGHLHFDYEGIVAGKIPQYVTGIGTGRVIEIG